MALPLNGGNPGTVGFSFVPTGGASVSYTISYTATCNSLCTIVGGNDQATNSTGSGTYNYSLGGQSANGVSNGTSFNPTLNQLTTALNSGTFVTGGTNQNLTLDITIQPGTPPLTETPEPGTVTQFSAGILLVGTVLAGRRKRRA